MGGRGVGALAGAAATALAVSCVAGARTGSAAIPTSSATDRRSGPSSVPGSISSGRIPRGRPSPAHSSSDQAPALGSSSWVVEASVRSPARRPVRSQPKRSEEHTSELQSRQYLVCRLLLEKKKKTIYVYTVRC